MSDGGGGCGGLNGLIFESGMKKKEHSVFNRIIRPCYWHIIRKVNLGF